MNSKIPSSVRSLNEAQAVDAFAALAQAQRLRAFRALVVAGHEGLTPGDMGTMLGMTPSGLSFHLKALTQARLATTEARGRNLIYRAEFGQMTALIAYMTEHCCGGAAC